MAKITKDTTLEKILEIKGAEKILLENDLPCLHCPHASEELAILKIGQVAEMYELNIDKILKELNQLK